MQHKQIEQSVQKETTTPLHEAIKQYDVDGVDSYLSNKPEAANWLRTPNENFLVPLELAASLGQLEIVMILIKHHKQREKEGLDYTLTNPMKKSPLILAIMELANKLSTHGSIDEKAISKYVTIIKFFADKYPQYLNAPTIANHTAASFSMSVISSAVRYRNEKLFDVFKTLLVQLVIQGASLGDKETPDTAMALAQAFGILKIIEQIQAIATLIKAKTNTEYKDTPAIIPPTKDKKSPITRPSQLADHSFLAPTKNIFTEAIAIRVIKKFVNTVPEVDILPFKPVALTLMKYFKDLFVSEIELGSIEQCLDIRVGAGSNSKSIVVDEEGLKRVLDKHLDMAEKTEFSLFSRQF